MSYDHWRDVYNMEAAEFTVGYHNIYRWHNHLQNTNKYIHVLSSSWR
jgi:hypothetical protein